MSANKYANRGTVQILDNAEDDNGKPVRFRLIMR